MICVLCHQSVDLLTLAMGDVGGHPAHDSCKRAYDAELAALLAEVEAMILAEPDPRRHRRHLRPAA